MHDREFKKLWAMLNKTAEGLEELVKVLRQNGHIDESQYQEVISRMPE